MSYNLNEEMLNIFRKHKSIIAVYSGGSFFSTGFDEEKSDVDLSVFLKEIIADEVISLENQIKKLSEKNNKKISLCYSTIDEFEKDFDKFFMHVHGKKRTSFLWDLSHSEIIYGKDILKLPKRIRFHAFEMFSNISELQDTLYKSLADGDAKKGVNISIICAKITLMLLGIMRSNKYDIIKTFIQNVDSERGNKIFKIYRDLKKGNDKEIDYQFLIDFCKFCQDISRKFTWVNEDECIKVQ